MQHQVSRYFDFNMLSDYKVPVPPITVQQSMVNLFLAYEERRRINEEIKDIMENICPILIKGAIEESKGVI